MLITPRIRPRLNHKKLIARILPLLALLFFASCSPIRNLVYFRDLRNTPNYSEEIKNNVDLKIQPGDLLNITVSSLNAESNILFNGGAFSAAGATPSARSNEGYLVDKNGAINFPVLGSVPLAGLTKEQATEKLANEIKKSVKNPIVNIKFVNFSITVLGEVGSPSNITVPNDRINLVEAIALAGDLTALGKRENVLIIREENGIRSTGRVNLASKDVFNSPYFYLQQHDVIYVEPVRIKGLQTTSASFYLSITSTVLSLLGIIIFAIR